MKERNAFVPPPHSDVEAEESERVTDSEGDESTESSDDDANEVHDGLKAKNGQPTFPLEPKATPAEPAVEEGGSGEDNIRTAAQKGNYS